MDFSFTPNSERAKLLNFRMRSSLATSLQYLSQELQPYFTFDYQELKNIIHNLKNGKRYSALTFALYTHLVYCVTQEDDKKTESILNFLCQEKPLELGRPDCISLNSSYFNTQENLLIELMNVDESADFQIEASDIESEIVFANRFTQSMDLISELMPELATEIESLVSQVIMVVPSIGSEFTFDGGSSYMLWGGLFLNIESHDNIVALIEVLAHESAHMLLFGFAAEEPLTLNPDRAYYNSPLREDKRPMEGIYHAMYVSARMFWAMNTLLENDELPEDFKAYAQEAVTRDIKAFNDAYNVVKEHGQLTQTGEALLAACLSYMQPYIAFKE